jgi:PBSX family phage terminase large subunit
MNPMMKTTPTLTQKLFKKQLDFCHKATARQNILTGAVSSGKTYGSIWKWLSWLKNEAPQKGAFLMTGKTERTLQRNILDPIVEMLGTKRFKINKGSGEAGFYGRKIYLAGANDERAHEKIRGLTLAGAYGDELTLWPESYYKMLLSRLRIKGARLYGTTNPDSPNHWLKVEFLEREGEINLRQFHFAIDDNVTLDTEYVDSIKKEYVGLWYKRFILGI